MYFPLLRAKRNELLALRESIGTTVNNKIIIPIIEAVNSTTGDLFRCLNELKDKKSNPVIIVNPQVGFFSKNQRKLNILIDEIIEINPKVCLAYWLTEGTTLDQLEGFFKKFPEQNLAMIHAASSKDVEGLLTLLEESENFEWNFFVNEKTGRKYVSTPVLVPRTF